MKKRVLALLLALTMTLALAACGSNGDDGKDKTDAPPVDTQQPAGGDEQSDEIGRASCRERVSA